MAWYLLARVLFVIAVTYAAALIRPFSANLYVDLVVGVMLGVAIVGIETRLRRRKSRTCSAR